MSVQAEGRYETVGTRFTAPIMKAVQVATCTRPEHTERAILEGVSGYAEAGSMVLIQAPPGAGTTTLLNCLSGKTETYKRVEGDVEYNGESILQDKTLFPLYSHSIARVRQQDYHYAKLTVGDTLRFAAECGLPDYLPFVKILRANRVLNVAKHLGIDHTLNTKVGNESLRGVSGGERKRVTIGEIMCGTLSSVIFMDNFSKGLDAATTFDICRSLQRYARASKAIIICALQQLGNEAFNLFDQVSEERTSYLWTAVGFPRELYTREV